jgi:hypothetical protein
MTELSGFPYFEVQFTKEGTAHDATEVAALTQALAGGPATDLVVLAHGWNNDMDDARRLYRTFADRMRAVADAGHVPAAAHRHLAVVGVLWPSKKFAEMNLIAGGAAGLSGQGSRTVLTRQIDDLAGVFSSPEADAALALARDLVPKLEDSPRAREQFADAIRSVLPRDAAEGAEEDQSQVFFALTGGQVMSRLGQPIQFRRPGSGGGAAALGVAGPGQGEAAGLGEFFSGVNAAARNLLNFATFYQMKERAGKIGVEGLNPLLRSIRAQQPDLRMHLVGHSFGARLVTAATAGRDGVPDLNPDSLTLLQGAFSHNGFAENFDGSRNGAFRRVVTEHLVNGPIVVTNTKNDTAVGTAYPLASLISGQDTSHTGDANDPFGGLGRNGAQHTPEASDGVLLGVGGAYDFKSGRVYNLNADRTIRDHSDICHDDVAYALFAALATS